MPRLSFKIAAPFFLLSLAQAVVPCPARSAVSYEKEVLEIFRAECLGCHNEDDKQGELDLSTYDAVLKGGISGNVVEPGDPDESLLYRLVAHLDQPSMPPETPKIARESIAIIKQWIEEGSLRDTSDESEKISNAGNLPVIAIPAARKLQESIYPPRLPRGSHQVTERDPALVALAASPTSPVVAVGGVRQVWFIRIDTDERIGRIGFSGGDVQCLQFSADGSLLVVGGGYAGASGTVEIWDVEKGQKLFQKSDYLDSVTCVAISADHQRLAVASTVPKIDLIDLKSGQTIKRLNKHTDWINAIKFSDDNVLIASADRAGGLQLWESWSGNHYRTLDGHKQSIRDLEWTYDSNFIASSGKDGFIRIWSAENGSESQKIKAHEGGVIRHARRADGGWVSIGSDQVLQIWSPEGKSISAATPFADTPTSLAYAPSSRMILAGDYLGTLMRLDEDTLKPFKLPSINPLSLDMQIGLTRKALNAARQKHSKLLANMQQLENHRHYLSVALENEKRFVAFYREKSEAMAASMLASRKQLRKVKSALSDTSDSGRTSALLIQRKLIANKLKQLISENKLLISQQAEQLKHVQLREADLARQKKFLDQAENELATTRQLVKHSIMSLAELIEESAYSTRYDLALADGDKTGDKDLGPTEKSFRKKSVEPSP